MITFRAATFPLQILYDPCIVLESVNAMNSLKKQTQATVNPSIALHDFTPNVTFLHYGVDSELPTATKQTPPATHAYGIASEPTSFNLWLSNYITAKKPYETNHQPIQKLHTFTPALNSDTPETCTTKTALRTPDFWLLTQQDRTLVKGGLRISLTTIESALIKKMLHHGERVVSKEELIRNIGREPEYYRGLEMCLSRLQEKFRRVNDGERLFRAVRNRGYCLTQKIKK